ncbi:MAG: DUF1592 domain-containing protein [Myxococcota bacterium]
MSLLPMALIAAGCGSRPDSVEPPAVEEETLPEATMYRLTEAEFRNTVEAVFGVTYERTLPRDFFLHGYRSVGAGALTVSPSELEVYEDAAWSIAATLVPDPKAVRERLGCSPATPLGHPSEPERANPCVTSGLAPWMSHAWRRPARQTELARLADLWTFTHEASGSDVLATQGVFAALVLAPEFLYRVEVGEPDPDGAKGERRFTSWELASRLSYFLLDGPPDEGLRAAAIDNTLQEPGALTDHAARLFDSPQGRDALVRFWEETLELHRLDASVKDPDAYPEFDGPLREAMKVEVRSLFEHVVFETKAPFGSLLTTDVTFVDDKLAALYGLRGPGGGTVQATLDDPSRGGVLGRAALMSIWSHATSSSPTLRGKFVRTRMLCQSIPPPPEGVLASLDAVPGEGSARDRLAAHAEDAACRGCHDIMDPPGFAFEHFDAIGRWRPDDHGFPIDPSGNLDGAAFANANELGAAVAAHPEFANCMALQLFRHAIGAAETPSQLPSIERLGQTFNDEAQSLEALVLALVDSDAFRRATPAVEGLPDRCGSGVEICNGLDDDCDGDIDEDVAQECDVDGALGVSDCALAACTLPEPDVEVCNGLDDDHNGAIDEGTVLVTPMTLAAITLTEVDAQCADACGAHGFPTSEKSEFEQAVSCVSGDVATGRVTSFDALSAYHEGCTADAGPGPDCNAAIHRMCAQTGSTTGWGPLDQDGASASIVCVDEATILNTSYSTLLAFDPECDGANGRIGPACNRAIHRYCQDDGFASGFGPLENSGDTIVVACLGEVP